MSKREPIVKRKGGGGSDELVIDGPIEGAGEFKGRPDGKTSGRGMLGLVSAIPPAPKLPNVRGVRMLAPTIPSERPSHAHPEHAHEEFEIAPMGLPDEAHGRDVDGNMIDHGKAEQRDTERSEPAFANGNVAAQDKAPASSEPEGKPAWVKFAALLIVALALAAIPVVHAALTAD